MNHRSADVSKLNRSFDMLRLGYTNYIYIYISLYSLYVGI